jgi:cytochrome c peroxidase
MFAEAEDTVSASTSFRIDLPTGISSDLWSYYVPKDNPMTAEKVELGRKLFFDTRLSADNTVSCATCHEPERAFTDGKRVAEGIGGRRGFRNSPTLLNAMFHTDQFWDGRASSLEAQAIMPLIDQNEMGNKSYDEIVSRLQSVPEYSRMFNEVFGGPVNIDRVGKAIAAFERTLVAGDSPFDRFMSGDLRALSPAAHRGQILFRGRARCAVCHTVNQSFPFFTDQIYRNTGVAANHQAFGSLAAQAMTGNSMATKEKMAEMAQVDGSRELGRYFVTGNTLDLGAFRTPSLRNIELTAPYFHDGSARTLLDVVKFYVKGGNDNPIKAWELLAVDLTEEEMLDLVEFLKSLTSDNLRAASYEK